MERVYKRWQLTSVRVVTGLLVFAFLTFCLVFKLSSATHKLAAGFEQQNMLHGWHAMLQSPLNAPYYILLRFMGYMNHALFSERLVGAMLGILLCVLFYYSLHKWLNYRFALLGTVLFGTNSYFLHDSRLVAPLVLQMFVSLGLIALFAASYRSTNPRILWLWALALPVLLYIPGAVWLIVAAVYVNQRKLRDDWSVLSASMRVLPVLCSLMLLAPLMYFLIAQTLQKHNVIALEAWAGVAQHGRLAALAGFGKTFANVPLHLFWHTNGSGIATLPAIGLAMSIVMLLGLYIAIRRFRDRRWRFTVSILLAAWFAAGLGGMAITVLLPVLYLLATVGLAYLLSEWYQVFPRNPIARSLGFSLVLAVVILSSMYNLRVYFVVWEHSQLTTQTFICPSSPPRPQACPQGSI